MSDLYDAATLLQAILREVKYRERVYPRLVASGKMTADHALTQIAMMKAIASDYEKLAERERLL